MIHNKSFTVEPDLLYEVLGEIINRIEVCGASPALTQAVTLTGNLQKAIGNQYNVSDPYSLVRIVETMAKGKEKDTS